MMTECLFLRGHLFNVTSTIRSMDTVTAQTNHKEFRAVHA